MSGKLPRCNKEVRKLVRRAVKGGAEFVGYSGSGHVKLACPSGATLVMPSSPSDFRWARNSIRDMRANGVTI